jgi:large subunit ribosomal protein L15
MKRKQKKVVRYRGKRKHGWGAKKKHRGSGNRGGKGNAGTGKRADCKKPSINQVEYFGKHGFHSIYKRKLRVINVGQLDSNHRTYKSMEKDGVLDLGSLGYTKLLSTGSIGQKFSIKIPEASPTAVEKVEKAGGKVQLTAVKPAKKAKSKS